MAVVDTTSGRNASGRIIDCEVERECVCVLIVVGQLMQLQQVLVLLSVRLFYSGYWI
jgi:hypothetical protein